MEELGWSQEVKDLVEGEAGKRKPGQLGRVIPQVIRAQRL